MNAKERILYVAMPLVILVAYIAGMALIPRPNEELAKILFSEMGIIELCTALFYLMAAVVGFVLCRRSRRLVGWKYQLSYLLFGLAALFVALEEINYGQYIFNFETPELLAAYNSKGDFNLHNLWGNMLARRLDLIAKIGFTVFLVVLPLVYTHQGRTYRRGSWTYYLLPGRQLILLGIIAPLLSWFDDVFGWFGIANSWTRATEMKEFYWGLAAMLWVLIVSRRVLRL